MESLAKCTRSYDSFWFKDRWSINRWDPHPFGRSHIAVVQTPCDLNCHGFWSFKKRLQEWNLDWRRLQRETSWSPSLRSRLRTHLGKQKVTLLEKRRGGEVFFGGEFGGCIFGRDWPNMSQKYHLDIGEARKSWYLSVACFPSVGFLWCCKQTKINLHHLHRTGAIKKLHGTVNFYDIFNFCCPWCGGSCFNEKKRRKQNCHVSHCSPWESDGALGYSEKAAMNFSTCCTTYWFHTFLGLVTSQPDPAKNEPFNFTLLSIPNLKSRPGPSPCFFQWPHELRSQRTVVIPLHLEEKHDGMVTTCHLTKANEVQFVNFFGVSTHFLEEIPANHGNE